MDATVINLLVQIPLVGIFVWFTLKRDASTREERKEWLATLQRISEQFTESIDSIKEDIKETNFITQQKLERNTRVLIQWSQKQENLEAVQELLGNGIKIPS